MLHLLTLPPPRLSAAAGGLSTADQPPHWKTTFLLKYTFSNYWEASGWEPAQSLPFLNHWKPVGLDNRAELPFTCPICDHHLHPSHHPHEHFSSGSNYVAIHFNKSYSSSELAFNKASIRQAHSLQAHP